SFFPTETPPPDLSTLSLHDALPILGTLDDSGPIVFSGGVTITQGTMHVEAERAEITTRGGDIQRVVLTGSPATMRQEMDDGSPIDRKSTRLNSSHVKISYAVFCLKK